MNLSLKKLLSKILTTIKSIQDTLFTISLYKTGTATYTLSKGSWETVPTYIQRGYVVQMTGTIKATASIASGSNIAEGNLKNIPKPAKICRAADYYGDNANVTQLDTAGHFISRNCGDDALSSGNTVTLSFVYITDGTML